jgi:sec-independent protein translocase protein TatC
VVHLPRYARRTNPEGRMAVMDHLRELRRRFIICFVIIAVGAVVGYLIYNQVLGVLKKPYCAVPYQHRLGGTPHGTCKLNFLAPLDGFTTRLKISIITGAVITAPLWLYQIWAFVTPGLRKNERKYTLIFIGVSSALFFVGVALAYAILWKGLPILVDSGGTGTQAALTVTAYVNFVVLMLVVFGASFELPLLIVMLNMAHVLPYKFLRRWQRLAIFLIFVFAGVATPTTDPFTMSAMAVAMIILYEAAVLFTFVHDRRRDKRAAAKQGEELPDDVASQINPVPEPIDGPTDHSAIP